MKFCLTGCCKEYIKISTTHRSIFQGSPQGGNVIDGTPHFSNQTLVGNIKTALVQDVINGLHLLHLDDPGVDRFRSFDQDLLQVVLCPMENLQTVGMGDCDIIITAKRQKKRNISRRLPKTKDGGIKTAGKEGRRQVWLSAAASRWSCDDDNPPSSKAIFPVTAGLGCQMTHGEMSQTEDWLADPNTLWSKSKNNP